MRVQPLPYLNPYLHQRNSHLTSLCDSPDACAPKEEAARRHYVRVCPAEGFDAEV
jgi:hypothetical protein